jgi:outer membrane protein
MLCESSPSSALRFLCALGAQLRLQTTALCAAIAMFALPTLAQAEVKIGFVNQERILRESAPAKRAQTKLEKEFANRKAELDKMEKQGRDLEAMLQKEGVTLPEAERAARDRQLSQLTRDFQRLSREFREDLNLRRNEELVSLQERANKVINEIAEKEKFDLIVQEAVFASSRIDITEKVLKALADK